MQFNCVYRLVSIVRICQSILNNVTIFALRVIGYNSVTSTNKAGI